MSTNKQHVATYLSDDQHEQWKERAEELGMSLSEYIQAMTEAGHKKFNASVNPDETPRELREQRNDLKDELDRARTRIQQLENRLHRSEQATITQYVAENPGVNYDDIVRKVVDTAPERVNEHLDALEGDALRVEGEDYYPKDGGPE